MNIISAVSNLPKPVIIATGVAAVFGFAGLMKYATCFQQFLYSKYFIYCCGIQLGMLNRICSQK